MFFSQFSQSFRDVKYHWVTYARGFVHMHPEMLEAERRYDAAVAAGETWRGMAVASMRGSLHMPAEGGVGGVNVPQAGRMQETVPMQTLLDDLRELNGEMRTEGLRSMCVGSVVP